jgi:hypothetical protein
MGADCILVIDLGRNAELHKSSPRYAEIYQRQLRETGNKARKPIQIRGSAALA